MSDEQQKYYERRNQQMDAQAKAAGCMKKGCGIYLGIIVAVIALMFLAVIIGAIWNAVSGH